MHLIVLLSERPVRVTGRAISGRPEMLIWAPVGHCRRRRRRRRLRPARWRCEFGARISASWSSKGGCAPARLAPLPRPGGKTSAAGPNLEEPSLGWPSYRCAGIASRLAPPFSGRPFGLSGVCVALSPAQAGRQSRLDCASGSKRIWRWRVGRELAQGREYNLINSIFQFRVPSSSLLLLLLSFVVAAAR